MKSADSFNEMEEKKIEKWREFAYKY
jgi:hypothetical protein